MKRNLFKFNKTLHGAWPKKQGPKNDKYSCAYNPQYALSINIPPGGDGNRKEQEAYGSYYVDMH